MKNQAFTLIELLVVVLIIGILAAIAVPQYQKAVLKSRLSEAMIMVKDIKNQQEMFYLQNGRYADNCKELGVELPVEAQATGNNFYLNKGSYYLYYHCKNNVTSSVSIRDELAVKDASFLLSVEFVLDHIPNEDLQDIFKNKQGKMYCYSHFTGLGLELCKSLGKEKINNNSYWI